MSSRWPGAGPRFGRSVKMIPLPHIVFRRPPKTRLNMCTTHPFVAQTQTRVARGAARCYYIHTHELEPLSHFPVRLRSNQIVIRVSCAPLSFLPSQL